MKRLTTLSFLLFLTMFSYSQDIWLHSTTYSALKHSNASFICSIDQFKITFKDAETFDYKGGLYITDTIAKQTKEITIPINYSVYLKETGNFIKVDGDKWSFIVKTESNAFRNQLLASPSNLNNEKYSFQYEFISKDFGTTWEIVRIKDIEE